MVDLAQDIRIITAQMEKTITQLDDLIHCQNRLIEMGYDDPHGMLDLYSESLAQANADKQDFVDMVIEDPPSAIIKYVDYVIPDNLRMKKDAESLQ